MTGLWEPDRYRKMPDDARPGTFLAIDLAGDVHSVAWCGAQSGMLMDSPGWLVRSRVVEMRSWAGVPAADPEAASDWLRAGEQIVDSARLWGFALDGILPVVLNRGGPPMAFSTIENLGGSSLCFPSATYVTSPRGIAPAVEVKDYVHMFEPALPINLSAFRAAYADLTEQAADDVQADGLEQDDSFLDRYAQICIQGRTAVLPVEGLSDLEWLTETWCRSLSECWGEPVSSDAIRVVALRLRCAIQPGLMFPAVLAESDGRLERALIHGTEQQAVVRRYDRAKLLTGDAGTGPSEIVDGGASISVPAGWDWQVNRMGHLMCRRLA